MKTVLIAVASSLATIAAIKLIRVANDRMTTDAQRRVTAAYRKKSVKQLVIRFRPNDDDRAMYDWLKSQENTTEYIKNLVRRDMPNDFA